MTARRIKPIQPERVVTPQCCVPLDLKQFAQHYLKRRLALCEECGLDPEKCTRPSSFEIDGKHYCTMHAGQVALRILVEQS